MHEKELRLALVCYGGVSLAIYMSGVTKEVLKAVRASKAYHSLVDPQARRVASFPEEDERGYETDTEKLYFELLQAHGPDLELHLIVDIVSGASAGGINAVFLARALAHDLTLDSHRQMWLEQADVTELMEPETMADRWSKFYLYPFFWLLNVKRMRDLFPNEEMRQKLSIFVRSRWFQPPFSGRRMMRWMLEACYAMRPPAAGPDLLTPQSSNSSLIPPGQRLDLFVSLTNYHGARRGIPLHDPAEITEREHRKSLHFSYRAREIGYPESDLDDDNVPGLAFAARATSSFPGAFPPTQLSDLTEALEENEKTWPRQEHFCAMNFEAARRNGETVENISFIDGSVVNNKPFAEAIGALSDRPAHRDVDRRIVYIDPVPETHDEDRREDVPGFFRAILASLSDIPRNQPITDELQWINAHNSESKRLHGIITSVRGEVDGIIDDLIEDHYEAAPSVAIIASWRDRINALARERAAYAYRGYVDTKVFAILERLSELIFLTCNKGGFGLGRELIFDLVFQWARETGLLGEPESGDILDESVRREAEPQNLIRFLRNFDVDFRIRRLRFVISHLNEIYHSAAARRSPLFDPFQLNAIKQDLYVSIDHLKDCWVTSKFEEPLREEIARFVSRTKEAELTAEAKLAPLLDRIASLMELEELDLEGDTVLSLHFAALEDLRVRRELFRVYIGFPFYDVLTLPLIQASDLSALEAIRVDRISPEDCDDIRQGGATAMLKGLGLAHFGAFFSRRARENDYLWGRLNGAERMVDFIVSAGKDAQGRSALDDTFDLKAFKKRLYLSILDAEAAHLGAIPDTMEGLRAEIEAL